MQKLFFLFIILYLVVTPAIASDTTTIQIRFKKAIFLCSEGKEIVDLNVSGGNEYVHVCKNGEETSSFYTYSGLINLSPEEYLKANDESISSMKNNLVNKFIQELDSSNKADSLEDNQEAKMLVVEKLNDIKRQINDISAFLDADDLLYIKTKINEQIDDVEHLENVYYLNYLK